MLGIITTMHTACGGESDGGVVGGDGCRKEVVAASTNNGSPRACNAKSRMGRERMRAGCLLTVHDFRFSHREKVDDPR